MPLENVEKANRKVAKEGGKEAEFEPYPFYLTAWEEDRYIIGQANIELDAKGNIVNDRVAARERGEFITADKADIQYMDVSPKQLVSVAASLILFLENDDANRALMGSNMQRQSVPLLRAEAPMSEPVWKRLRLEIQVRSLSQNETAWSIMSIPNASS